MGAGNISEFAPALIKELDRANREQVKVAVVYGGESAEREVSLHSGRCVHEALVSKGYDAKLVDVSELLLSKGDLSLFVGSDRPDVAFLAIHGTRAEDGALQGMLEMLHMPYTGPGIQASSISINKALTKQILQQAGLRVPKGQLLTQSDQEVEIKAPAIVKPNAQGSTVGLGYVERNEDMAEAVRKAFQYDDAVLVEEWIQGIETSVPVLGDRALLPVEIAPATGRYDFASKYVPGATEEIIPARVPEQTLKKLQEAALIAHRALGCEGATRTDIFVCGDELIVLEVNTLPGMTKTSLLPNSAAAAGIPYEELVDWMVKDALKRYAEKT
jgi:D-alanine--D-alanine ligase